MTFLKIAAIAMLFVSAACAAQQPASLESDSEPAPRDMTIFEVTCTQNSSPYRELAVIRYGVYDDGEIGLVGAIKIPPANQFQIAQVEQEGLNLRIDWSLNDDGTYNDGIAIRADLAAYYDFRQSSISSPTVNLQCSEPEIVETGI